MSERREPLRRTCPGCHEQFPSHRRNVVWCSTDCNLMTRMARLGQCVICGEEDPDRIWFFFTMEAKTASIHQGESFAEAHVLCRRSELAEIGRVLKCSCARCKADRGEEAQPPARRDQSTGCASDEAHEALRRGR